jgi:innexin
MEAKCWIEGVFLDRNLFNFTKERAIAEGVGSPLFMDQTGYIHQNYYQWIPLILALEALLFLLPNIIWDFIEAGTISGLLPGIYHIFSQSIN